MVIEVNLAKVAICFFLAGNMLSAYWVYRYNEEAYRDRPFVLFMSVMITLAIGSPIMLATICYELWRKLNAKL